MRVGPIPIAWNPSLPIYASEASLKSVSDQYGWIGGIAESGALRCILPYNVIRKPGFQMVRFRTATIPMETDRELSVEEERIFLNEVVEHFKTTEADVIIPSGNTAIFRTYPEGASAAPYGTIVNNLQQPEETLMRQMRKTHQQNIRKASNAGVQIKSGVNYLDVAHQLVADTLKRSGTSALSSEQFRSRILALGEYVRVFVAEHEGRIHGCMVSPFSQHTAYSWYAGSVPQPIRGAMHLLHWEAMRQFRSAGVQWFDFQGVRIQPEKDSKQEGILSYKRGFGGDLMQGYIWKQPLRPLKSLAYSFAVKMISGGDFVDQEHARLAV